MFNVISYSRCTNTAATVSFLRKSDVVTIRIYRTTSVKSLKLQLEVVAFVSIILITLYLVVSDPLIYSIAPEGHFEIKNLSIGLLLHLPSILFCFIWLERGMSPLHPEFLYTRDDGQLC
jgi:hypothetical protein